MLTAYHSSSKLAEYHEGHTWTPISSGMFAERLAILQHVRAMSAQELTEHMQAEAAKQYSQTVYWKAVWLALTQGRPAEGRD